MKNFLKIASLLLAMTLGVAMTNAQGVNTRQQLKTWYITGSKPTEAQYWSWLDSYWHKYDSIPKSSIKDFGSYVDTGAVHGDSIFLLRDNQLVFIGVVNEVAGIDSSKINYFADSAVYAPPPGAVDGDVFLILSPATGGFAARENQVAKRISGVYNYSIPTVGQILSVSNPISALYKFDGVTWKLTRRSISWGGDSLGIVQDIGTLDNHNVRVRSNGHIGIVLDVAGKVYLKRYDSIPADNFLKFVDPATGEIGFGKFDTLRLVKSNHFALSNDSLYVDTTVYVTAETDPVFKSDSAAMLLPYLRKNVAAATYVPYTGGSFPSGAITDSILTERNSDGTVRKVPYSDIVPNLQHVTDVGNTTSNNVLFKNSTLASSGSPIQSAPWIELDGNYWNGSASVVNGVRIRNAVTDYLHTNLVWEQNQNGIYNTMMTLSDGTLYVNYVSAAGMSVNPYGIQVNNLNSHNTGGISGTTLAINTYDGQAVGGGNQNSVLIGGNAGNAGQGAIIKNSGKWNTFVLSQQYGLLTYADTSTNNDLLITPYLLNVNPANVHYLINAGTNSNVAASGTHTPKFTVDLNGNTHVYGNLTVDGTYPGGGGSSTFAGLTDVSLTSLASGDMLKYNGTSWINRTPSNVRTDLGLVIGTNVQAYDADLTTYAGITPSANVQTLLGSADYSAFRTSLSLNNVENTALSAWAGTSNITTLGTIGTGTWQGTAIADAYISSAATWNAKQTSLTRTAVKTSAYTAAVNDLVPVNTTSGNVTITLPTAPADKSRITVKHIIQGGTNTVTVATGGSDVFNKTGGATSLTLSLLAQGVELQYDAANAIWTVLSDDLPLSQLDARYVATYTSQTANTFFAAPNGSSGTPTFRAIVAADIPTLNQNTTGSAGSVANALSIGAELISGGASSYNGSAGKTLGIQPASVTNTMMVNHDITINGTATSLGGSINVRPLSVILGSNQTTTSTTMAGATGVSVSVTAGVTYRLEIDIKSACDNTGGVKIGLSISGSPTLIAGEVIGETNLTTNLRYSEITALDGTTNFGNYNTVASNASERLFCEFTAGSSGTAQLFFGSVTNTQTSTIRSGTIMILTPLQ